jgi:hypothetical protein
MVKCESGNRTFYDKIGLDIGIQSSFPKDITVVIGDRTHEVYRLLLIVFIL